MIWRNDIDNQVYFPACVTTVCIWRCVGDRPVRVFDVAAVMFLVAVVLILINQPVPLP